MSDDIPPLAVFLALYAMAAVISVLLFEHHRRRRLSRTIPIILFLFSGERMLTCMLRIAWAHRLASVRLAVASQIFLQAGVLLLFLLNLIMAEMIWLGRKPRARTRLGLKAAIIMMSVLTVSSLIMVITSIILSVYTLNQKTISTCRDVQRAGATYFLFLSTMPLIMLAFASSSSSTPATEKHGLFHMESLRTVVTIISSLLCILNAGFKTGVIWAHPHSLFQPAWYHSKACLYAFVFTTEICVLVILYAARVDLRFQPRKDQGNTPSDRSLEVLMTVNQTPLITRRKFFA